MICFANARSPEGAWKIYKSGSYKLNECKHLLGRCVRGSNVPASYVACVWFLAAGSVLEWCEWCLMESLSSQHSLLDQAGV